MQRANSWNRHSYPVQTKSPEPLNERLPSPPAAEKPAPVKLRKSIKACQDSENRPPKGRTIVLCLDGTGDKFDNDNSNIVHLVSCLKKGDPDQVTYYQAGIGTYGERGLSGGFSAAADMAVGSGLGLHVRDAYNYLMHSYQENDKICIFGFSRGAYSARCLAGMVHKVGLLPTRNVAQIPFAYEFYKDDTPEGWKQSAEFKKTFSIDVSIYFLGVFDSVASVGFIPRQLPLSSTPTTKTHHFRHAIALDERRAKFKVCRYQAKDWKAIEEAEAKAKASAEYYASLTSAASYIPAALHLTSSNGSAANGGTANGKAANGSAVGGSAVDGSADKWSPPVSLQKKGKMTSETESFLLSQAREARKEAQDLGYDNSYDTDVSEVWFLGCHADVGGGAVLNEERHKLSNIPLRWMIRQCFECDTGIIFKTKSLAEFGLDVHTLWPKYEPLDVPILGPPPSVIERYKEGLPPMIRRSSKLVSVDDQDPHTKRKKKEEGYYDLKIFEEEHQRENQKTGEWLPEQVEDYFDAMSVMNDQLEVAKTWWILEFLPVEYKMQKTDSDDWMAVTGMNLGRYRGVEDKEPKMHWTVQRRIENMGYKVNARIGRNAAWQLVA